MKVAYICSKMRTSSYTELAENIAVALHAGELALKLGYMPIIPHTMSCNLRLPIPEEEYMERQLELVRRSDIILVPWDGKAAPVVTDGMLAELQEFLGTNRPLLDKEIWWLDMNTGKPGLPPIGWLEKLE